MTTAIALGSNLPSTFGPPEANLREALHRLSALGRVTAVSTFQATDPVGYLNQPQFLNAAALLDTTLPPLDLLHALLAIEHAMGRDRANTPAKGPRIIDLANPDCIAMMRDYIAANPALWHEDIGLD